MEEFDEKVSYVGFVFDTGEELFGPSVEGTRILAKVADVEDRLGIRQIVFLQVVVYSRSWVKRERKVIKF